MFLLSYLNQDTKDKWLLDVAQQQDAFCQLLQHGITPSRQMCYYFCFDDRYSNALRTVWTHHFINAKDLKRECARKKEFFQKKFTYSFARWGFEWYFAVENRDAFILFIMRILCSQGQHVNFEFLCSLNIVSHEPILFDLLEHGCFGGHFLIVRVLCRQFSNANKQKIRSEIMTFLKAIAKSGSCKILKLLVRKKIVLPTYDFTLRQCYLFRKACKFGHSTLLQYLWKFLPLNTFQTILPSLSVIHPNIVYRITRWKRFTQSINKRIKH